MMTNEQLSTNALAMSTPGNKDLYVDVCPELQAAIGKLARKKGVRSQDVIRAVLALYFAADLDEDLFDVDVVSAGGVLSAQENAVISRLEAIDAPEGLDSRLKLLEGLVGRFPEAGKMDLTGFREKYLRLFRSHTAVNVAKLLQFDRRRPLLTTNAMPK